MPATLATYPDFEPQIRDLVGQHRQSKKQRLHLAVYFAPPRRSKRDVFLFEVLDGFGGDEISPDQKLFEFAYGSTPAIPLPDETSLRVVITNSTELEKAVCERWRAIDELRAARKENQAIVIYADAKGKRLWDLIS